MAYPTPKVEIAFNDGPYVASPTWTDVTSYVREMTVDRGRDDDWGTFSGDAMVVLDNRTRLFDPFYTSGTYYGKLLPRRQIRITASTGPVTNTVTNPSLTTNTTNWSANGTTLSRITSDFYTSPASLQAVCNATSNVRAVNGLTTRIPVKVGLPHTVSVYIKCPSVSGNFRFWISQFAAASGGSSTGTVFSPIQTIGVGAWTLMTYTITPTQPYLVIEINLSTASVGQVFLVDDLSVSLVVYPVFRGYIAGWPPVWTDAGKDSTVTLSCMDALGLLASETLPADWSRSYILSTSPRHYWPCDEPVTPFVAGSVLKDYGSVPLNMTSSVYASNGTQLAQGLVNSAIQGTANLAASGASGNIQGVGNFSASAWIIPDTDATYGTGGETYNCNWAFEYESTTSAYRLYMLDYNSSVQRIWYTTQQFDGGAPRMLSFTFNGTTKAITFYVNGVLQTMTTVAPTGIFPFPSGEGYFLGSGQTQQFIVWDGIQTQTVFENVYKYSTVNLPETTAARFMRLIAETAFPASLTSGPSAPASSVLDITDDAPKLASELQRLADSEFAPLFVTRDGVVTLYYQNQIRTQTRSIVSQGTYGSGGYAIGQDVAIAYDGDSMRNQASITMSGGGVYVKDNATSQSTYGAAQESLDTQVSSLADAQDIGNIVTGWGGQVYPKADPVEVVLSPSADWSNALDRELNDRITLVVAPPTGNTITTPMLVSRISHSVVPGEWRTTFEGSARWAAVWIWGQSTWGGTDLLG